MITAASIAPHQPDPLAVLCLAGQWSAVESMCYSTYKLFLCHISSVFDGVRMRWNVEYDKVGV
jgi:hypothetical protein